MEDNGKFDLGKTIGRLEAKVNGIESDVSEMKKDFKEFKNFVETNVIGKPPTLWKIGMLLASGIAAGFGIDKFF